MIFLLPFGLTLWMINLPFWTRVLPWGKVPSSRCHKTVGFGSPPTSQSNMISSPFKAVTSSGSCKKYGLTGKKWWMDIIYSTFFSSNGYIHGIFWKMASGIFCTYILLLQVRLFLMKNMDMWRDTQIFICILITKHILVILYVIPLPR